MALTRNTYQRNSTWNAPYTFSGKEKDAETGYGYFGARYYDSGLSIWLSVDPMSDKYPSMSPYNYCANNPVILVDPDGRYFVGIDGLKVEVKIVNGVIVLGDNATPELIRLTEYTNNSNSKTAQKQFLKIANNNTKVHLVISKEKSVNLGLHLPHDEKGVMLGYDPDKQIFDGMPSYNSDGSYKEATIILYEETINRCKNQLNYQEKKPLSKENAIVAIFSHESEHNLNKKDIKAILDRLLNKENNRDIERAAKKIENKVLKEIYYN